MASFYDDPFETQGLDLSSMVPMAAQSSPQAKKAGGGNKLSMVLAALAPVILAKGGMPAMTGLIQGIQQAKARKAQESQQQFQNDRLTQQDARLTQQDAEAEAYRQQQIAQQQNRLGFDRDKAAADYMGKFGTALEGATSEDDVRNMLTGYQQGGSMLGIPAGRFESMALTLATPTKLQQRAAAKAWASIEKTHTPEQLARLESYVNERGEPAPAMFQVGNERLPIPEIRRRMGGGAVDAQGQAVMVPPKPPTPNVATPGSFEEYVNLPPDQQALREQQRKRFLTADDKPAAPSGGEKPLTQNQRANIISSRRNGWERFSKAIRERETYIARVDAGLAALDRGNRNAATQAIIIAFNKLQDEGSVVREGEYARSEQLVPLINRIEGAMQRITMGGANMTDADLRALAREAKAIAAAMKGISEDAAANYRRGIEEELDDYQIPHSRVFGGSTIGRSPAGVTGGAPGPNPFRRN